MSIMRSFTTRRKQPELDGSMTLSSVGRAASQRGIRPIARNQISAPVELVSTTNMLSYNAPNIAGTKPIEHRDLNSGSSSSSEESDSAGSVHSHDTDPTDLSSADASPVSTEPSANHLSHFFKSSEDDVPKMAALTPSPMLPRRAPSHSKRAHEALSRQRSVQRAMSPPPSDAASQAQDNPFGKELAQLDAVAEEFSGARTEAEIDAIWLKSRGLARFAASDYLSEIDGLVCILLDDRSPTAPDFFGWF